MKFAGIDIGSRSIELVVVDENGGPLLERCADTGYDPLAEAKKLMQDTAYDRIMATGYGRNLFELAFDSPTVTEIKAHALGVRALFPKARTILDIGGQDSKAIALLENGKVKKFEMNDRCAAGTGKFLEIMAKALGFDIAEFGQMALESKAEMNISSMCTVFAESEVTSLIAKGEDRQAIARGLHASIIRRSAAMLNRLPPQGRRGLHRRRGQKSLHGRSAGRGLGPRSAYPGPPGVHRSPGRRAVGQGSGLTDYKRLDMQKEITQKAATDIRSEHAGHRTGQGRGPRSHGLLLSIFAHRNRGGRRRHSPFPVRHQKRSHLHGGRDPAP